MRHSLHSHILHLENLVQSLKDQLTSFRITSAERERLELQVSAAELALERYREAYALELSVSDPTPPGRPGGASDRNGETPERLRRDKKKDGLARVAAAVRMRSRVRVRSGSPVVAKRTAARG